MREGAKCPPADTARQATPVGRAPHLLHVRGETGRLGQARAQVPGQDGRDHPDGHDHAPHMVKRSAGLAGRALQAGGGATMRPQRSRHATARGRGGRFFRAPETSQVDRVAAALRPKNRAHRRATPRTAEMALWKQAVTMIATIDAVRKPMPCSWGRATVVLTRSRQCTSGAGTAVNVAGSAAAVTWGNKALATSGRARHGWNRSMRQWQTSEGPLEPKWALCSPAC